MVISKNRMLSWAAGFTFAALYLALLTQQYIGDGLRWYGAIAGLRPIELGGTNHLLYPLVGHAWFLAWTSLGLPASYALAQSMNAVLGGVALGFFCAIVQAWTGRVWLALAATITLGLSRAFSLHGVDMTEPMPGVACVMAGIWLASRHALRPGRRGWLILAGGLIGLGGAIYQANIIAVIGACALVGLAGPARGQRARWFDTALIGLAAGSTAAAVYLTAFMTLGGAQTLGEAFKASLQTVNERYGSVYAEISLRRLGVLVFGLADSLFGIRGVEGLGTNLFARGLTREVIIALVATGCAALVPAAVSLLYARLPRVKPGERRAGEGRVLLALVAWLVPQLGLAFYFGARYSKLWVLALAVILLIVAVLLEALERKATQFRGSWRVGAALFMGVWVVPVSVVGLAANMIPDHNTPQACGVDAQKIAALLGPRDLLVSDWGGLACAPEAPFPTLSLVETAVEARLNPKLTADRLAGAISAVQSAGGSVYFHVLLDMSAPEWEPFFGQRLRLPRTVLDPYRSRATIALPLAAVTIEGGQMNLWKLAP